MARYVICVPSGLTLQESEQETPVGTTSVGVRFGDAEDSVIRLFYDKANNVVLETLSPKIVLKPRTERSVYVEREM